MTPDRIPSSRRDFLKGLMGAAGAAALMGAGVRRVAPEAPRPTPAPFPIKTPDRLPTVQPTPKARTEGAVSPENPCWVDFATTDLCLTGENHLAGLLNRLDGSQYIGVLDLDLSVGKLQFRNLGRLQPPFVGTAIAASPVNPNLIVVIGKVNDSYGREKPGMLITASGQNFKVTPGNQGEMKDIKIPDGQFAFVTQQSIFQPNIPSIAKVSLATGGIVEDIPVTGTISVGLMSALSSVSPNSYTGHCTVDSPGYAKLDINGSGSVKIIDPSISEGWAMGKLISFRDGTNSVVGLVNTDELAPGSTKIRLGILYINVNDVQKYAIRPNLAFYPFITAGDVLINSAVPDLVNRKLYMGIYTMAFGEDFSRTVKLFIESASLDNPDDLTKREYTEVAPGTYDSGMNSINNMYLFSQNGRLGLAVAGTFGIRVADVTNGFKQLQPTGWQSIGLPVCNNFLPLITRLQ